MNIMTLQIFFPESKLKILITLEKGDRFNVERSILLPEKVNVSRKAGA